MLVFLVALLLVPAFGSSQINKTAHTSSKGSKPEVEVEVDVEIGRKKHDCTKLGICNIVISGGPKLHNAVMGYSAEYQTITLKLHAEKLRTNQPDKMVYFSGKNNVTFNDEYVIPTWLKEELHAPQLKMIPAGEYQLNTLNGYYIITIQL
ncbi:MAG: hypothetical protein WAT79_11010 [Saprospiraceae bacterium]